MNCSPGISLKPGTPDAYTDTGGYDVEKAKQHLNAEIEKRRKQMEALRAQIDLLTSMKSTYDNWIAVGGVLPEVSEKAKPSGPKYKLPPTRPIHDPKYKFEDNGGEDSWLDTKAS